VRTYVLPLSSASPLHDFPVASCNRMIERGGRGLRALPLRLRASFGAHLFILSNTLMSRYNHH